MKVIFKTNIDNYQKSCFPTNITQAPRRGDVVNVTKSFFEYFRSKRLPTTLEVVNVTWDEIGIICELHYRSIDIQTAKLNGISLF